MTKEEFIEKVYEIAFGDDAYSKGYTFDDVISRLEEYEGNSFNWENYTM